MARISRLVIAILFCSTVSAAQQPRDGKAPDAAERGAPSGTVSGHVYFADTKAPARKAMVYLEPVATLQRDAPPDRGGGHDDGSVILAVGTQFDGSYLFTHVASGSYYVIAACPGYVSVLASLSLAEARSPYGEWAPLGPQQKVAKNKILESMPRVNVQSNLPATVDVFLERGGAISGSVTYDDAGPAASLRVGVISRMIKNGAETWASLDFQQDPFTLPIVTNDRGNFRISGLPAGKYAIEVVVEFSNNKMYLSSSGSVMYGTNAHSATISVYSGNTPREKDAVGFAVQAGEERTGADIVIPISKLHTIKGNIVSAHDSHVVNSGQVDLLNADDHSPAGSDGLTEDDPSFMLSFIFEGDYILSSPTSSDVDYVPLPRTQGGDPGPPQYRTNPRHLYGSGSKPLHVDGDMDGVTLAVPEPTPKEAQMYKDAMRQQEQENHTTAPQ
jgi:hypothetical protein